MFFGEYRHQLDSKGRLRLPAKLRVELGDHYMITIGVPECLFVFSKEKSELIKQKLQGVPLGNEKAQTGLRMLFTQACEPDEDAQGRFVMPAKLRKYADLSKDIVIVGVGDRVEIWNEKRWDELNESQDLQSSLAAMEPFGI